LDNCKNMNPEIDLLSDLLVRSEIIYKNYLINQNLRLNNLITCIPHKQNNIDFIDFSKLNNPQNKTSLKNFGNILLAFKEIQEKENIKSKEESIRFNVLNFFHIDETLHSRLLGFFLDKNASHGQGDLFLRKFIEKLGYGDYEIGKWKVTIEKQRIDILIERKTPHSAIIIENKSNNACDQENQIYRYWHRTIYSKSKEHSSDNNKFKIIYLTSNNWKLPNENTLVKPKNYSKKLPEKVPLKVNVWKFNTEIKSWLIECLPLLSNQNHKLREYIKQYIEYWN